MGFLHSGSSHVIANNIGRAGLGSVAKNSAVGLWAAKGSQQKKPSNKDTSAPGSWRDPAGESPAQVRGSAGLVASVASWEVTTMAKRTQQLFRVGD